MRKPRRAWRRAGLVSCRSYSEAVGRAGAHGNLQPGDLGDVDELGEPVAHRSLLDVEDRLDAGYQ